jgi:hypothetical protein
VTLLRDLAALADRQGNPTAFTKPFLELRAQHRGKPSLLARFDTAALPPLTRKRHGPMLTAPAPTISSAEIMTAVADEPDPAPRRPPSCGDPPRAPDIADTRRTRVDLTLLASIEIRCDYQR